MHDPDIQAGRLSHEELEQNFADAHPPLTSKEALIEANRCHFCFDAPCVHACPTAIDIPNFIRKIATGNTKGAARDILSQNIMGGICARVCPTEVLCEGRCVRDAQESRPVLIGALQRYATDWAMERDVQFFERAEETGKRVAVVGGGPAGFSCAHRLARYGHQVVIFEGAAKPGGLNEYGIAAYKVVEDFAQREVEYLMQIGGIEVRCHQRLGNQVQLHDLQREFDAVFLGVGLAGVNALRLPDESLGGVHNAVDYIAELRQAKDLSALTMGRRVVVIGGGNTAIDIAVQSKKLGAEDVTMVYRRGLPQMTATWKEREFAQVNGVKVKEWMKPVRLHSEQGQVSRIEFEYTRIGSAGDLEGTGETTSLPADIVFKAIGQHFVAGEDNTEQVFEMDRGKLAVDANGETSIAGVWAGGDCVWSGEDLTVQAVDDGQKAAEAIHARLTRNS